MSAARGLRGERGAGRPGEGSHRPGSTRPPPPPPKESSPGSRGAGEPWEEGCCWLDGDFQPHRFSGLFIPTFLFARKT